MHILLCKKILNPTADFFSFIMVYISPEYFLYKSMMIIFNRIDNVGKPNYRLVQYLHVHVLHVLITISATSSIYSK